MTVRDLETALQAVTVNGAPTRWAHYAWDSAPAGDFGVWGEYDARQFHAGNRYAESITEVAVDYYTKTDDGAAKTAIENAFKALQERGLFSWHLSAVAYEADTHFLHYSWEAVCNAEV